MLIIEDDDNLMRGIAFAFEKDGYTVATANTIKSGQLYFEQGNVDIVILDIGLPDGSGLEFCKSIREKSITPVIIDRKSVV
jgi:DNA-binding response OmpR family regulator